jgi:hypothetical protein
MPCERVLAVSEAGQPPHRLVFYVRDRDGLYEDLVAT